MDRDKRTGGGRVRIFALCEWIVFSTSFSPTAAEIYRKGRRAETEVAITGEGGTQLAATHDRCSS